MSSSCTTLNSSGNSSPTSLARTSPVLGSGNHSLNVGATSDSLVTSNSTFYTRPKNHCTSNGSGPTNNGHGAGVQRTVSLIVGNGDASGHGSSTTSSTSTVTSESASFEHTLDAISACSLNGRTNSGRAVSVLDTTSDTHRSRTLGSKPSKSRFPSGSTDISSHTSSQSSLCGYVHAFPLFPLLRAC